jgi:riboflavin biosynthesis pyrimidine reductase
MFASFRKELGIKKPVSYAVITNSPDEVLSKKFINPFGFRPLVITKQKDISVDGADILSVDGGLQTIFTKLFENGIKRIFIDGGPTLIASLIEENLLDEIFLTIAPKIFGSESGVTQTLAEGKLFPSDMIVPWTIKDLERVNDEIFIRYAKKR